MVFQLTAAFHRLSSYMVHHMKFLAGRGLIQARPNKHISNTRGITGVVKNYLRNQQRILHHRASYETLSTYKSALLIQQILHGYI